MNEDEKIKMILFEFCCAISFFCEKDINSYTANELKDIIDKFYQCRYINIIEFDEK